MPTPTLTPAARSDTVSPAALRTARGNALLDALTDSELTLLLDSAVEAPLDLATVLYEPGQHVPTIHFPLSGVISIITDLGDNTVVEAATIGNEGMSGISVFLGAGAPTERATVQVQGHAITLDAAAFEHAAEAIDGPLYTAMRRYTQVLFTQLARNAACNRVHTVQQRTARWLLTTADRMPTATFELTQHFLAQMLSVRRASVSQVANALATQGAISYARGTLTILDRPQLLTQTCSCYQILRDTTERALHTLSAS